MAQSRVLGAVLSHYRLDYTPALDFCFAEIQRCCLGFTDCKGTRRNWAKVVLISRAPAIPGQFDSGLWPLYLA
jgi:hypothetical protein